MTRLNGFHILLTYDVRRGIDATVRKDVIPDWRLEYGYAGKTWFDLGAKGAPSKWVTLRARRALMRLGGDA